MLSLSYRQAAPADIAQLAAMNQHLIQDEGHNNPMTLAQLEARMSGWLTSQEYSAVLFYHDQNCAAYALFKIEAAYTYLRQFFVARDVRRQGIGRAAMDLLLARILPQDRPVRLDVLIHNERGLQFWHAVGFTDYSLTMTRPPGTLAPDHPDSPD
ncbi:MAG: GNAT family N-acetyltransferase [Chloroflexi bacterium]|nr:GNAT family N-acetyltransferase [Chloroflexota bacterium]